MPRSSTQRTTLARWMPAEQHSTGGGAGSRYSDVVAGLCVAGLLLPEAVAYAGLAHVPVIHALTASLVGLLVYGLWGGSRFAVVAPTSSTATLAAAAAASLNMVPGLATEAAYLQVFFALVLASGLLLLLLSVAKQGQLSSFVSRPVLRGFAFALAITIVIKQLPDAMGFELPAHAASDPLHIAVYALTHVGAWHAASMAVAMAAALLLLVFKRLPRLPASMLVIVVAIGVAYGLDLQAMGVHEIGVIQSPTLHVGLPSLPASAWMRVAELAFGLVMLVFAESWGSMRSMALARGDTLDANRELLVLGACNMGSALFQGMPVGAGFSATAANAAAGAASKRAGLVAWVAMVLVISLALPALQWLPRPVLAVVVVSALWHALSPRPLIAVWRMNRDRVLIVAAALAVLALGVLDGMLVAVALSIVVALRRFSQPVVHELGELGTSRNYVDVQTQGQATAKPGLLVLRPEEPLFFGSAERVMAEVLARTKGRDAVSTVILSLEESADLDSTAVECLLELDAALTRIHKTLLLTRVKTTVRELLARWDPQGLGHDERMFWSVADGVEFALRDHASFTKPAQEGG